METRSAFVIVIMKYLSILKLQLSWAVYQKCVPEFLDSTIGCGALVHWSACEKAAILVISGVCVYCWKNVKTQKILIMFIPIQSRRVDPWIRGFVVIVARGAVRCV